jgi:hypothetical protein
VPGSIPLRAFNLPWWDRLFGTYRSQPAAGHQGMTFGIDQFRNHRELSLWRMLLQPFRGGAGAYPLGQRRTADRMGEREESPSEKDTRPRLYEI